MGLLGEDAQPLSHCKRLGFSTLMGSRSRIARIEGEEALAEKHDRTRYVPLLLRPHPCDIGLLYFHGWHRVLLQKRS